MLRQGIQEPTTNRKHRAPSKRAGLQPGAQCKNPQMANGQFFFQKNPQTRGLKGTLPERV